ncbi:hypothetical protein SDJN03_18249, partial [Cucurbita argyrosperma subsp. sororia]
MFCFLLFGKSKKDNISYSLPPSATSYSVPCHVERGFEAELEAVVEETMNAVFKSENFDEGLKLFQVMRSNKMMNDFDEGLKLFQVMRSNKMMNDFDFFNVYSLVIWWLGSKSKA